MATPLEILFEDDDLIAVSKPTGLLAESSYGDVDSMLSQVSDYIGKAAIAYHRIDRGTTGCMLFGKTARFNRQMAQLFSAKKVRKEYWAIVSGQWPKAANKVDVRIESLGGGAWRTSRSEGKAAVTTFRVLGRGESATWISALPKTGRTHQIRLHCAHVGCAIIGDSRYGESTDSPLMLHARSIRLRHPGSGESLNVVAEAHEHWKEWAMVFPKLMGRDR